MSGIFSFNPKRRRLSNAVAELGTQCPCKSLNQRPCCRETSDRNGDDTRCGRNRKSITAAKIRKDAIFSRSFKCVARMERSVIRDCHEASIPPRISLRSIRATLAEICRRKDVAGLRPRRNNLEHRRNGRQLPNHRLSRPSRRILGAGPQAENRLSARVDD